MIGLSKFIKSGNPAKYAIGRKHEPGKMNKGETEYARHLNLRLAAGDIQWWAFESMTFYIGENCRITPDFAVMAKDCTIELHDVKGRKSVPDAPDSYWAEEDAVIKLKMLANLYPFMVCIVWPRKGGGGWDKKEVPPGKPIKNSF